MWTLGAPLWRGSLVVEHAAPRPPRAEPAAKARNRLGPSPHLRRLPRLSARLSPASLSAARAAERGGGPLQAAGGLSRAWAS